MECQSSHKGLDDSQLLRIILGDSFQNQGKPLPGSESVEVVRKVAEKMDSVCQIVVPQNSQGADDYGTGFLIGDGLLMTNHHVIPDEMTAENSIVRFFYDSPGKNFVEVKCNPYEKDQGFFLSSPDPQEGELKIGQLDFTIVALHYHPELDKIYRLSFCIFNALIPKSGDRAILLHHPTVERQQRYKLISLQKQVQKIENHTIFYETATAGGSSGAPVMNEQALVFGLHKGACRQPIGLNRGILMNSIIQELDKRGYSEKIKKWVCPTRYSEIKSHITTLKDNYFQNLAEIPLILTNEGFPIKEFFTQLSIVSHDSQEKKEEEVRKRDPHQIEKDSLREIYARLNEAEKSIEIENLFDKRNEKTISRVLVLGRAGIGKSVLCQKIAYDWSSGLLFKNKFRAIYHLKLRELNSWITQHPLLDNRNPVLWLSSVIASYCYEDECQNVIIQELKDHPQEILLMFDGWDEASPDLVKAIERCFREKSIYYYLLTSRPGVTNKIQVNFDLTVENMGFSSQHIETYTRKIFKYTRCEGFQAFLKNIRFRSNLFAISHIPIQLQILCSLWRRGETEFPNTLTPMFSKIIDCLFEWEQEKGRDFLNDKSKKRLLYKALGEIALKGLESKQLIIPKQLIQNLLKQQEFDTIVEKDLINTGIIKACNKTGEMYFIHLTYQEYSIANYISSLDEKEQCLFIQTYRYRPQFHLVIRMLAGCIWEKSMGNTETLVIFFQWLYSGYVDMVGSYQVELVLSCLDECRNKDLENVIWEKYKIVDFVDYLLKLISVQDCLLRLMALSNRAFRQVMKKTIQSENFEEQSIWFAQNLKKCIRAEYLSIDFFNFMKKMLESVLPVRASALRALGAVSAHADKKSIATIFSWLQNYICRGSITWDTYQCMAEPLQEIAAYADKETINNILNWLQELLEKKNGLYEQRKFVAIALGEIAAYVDKETIGTILNSLQGALIDKHCDVQKSASEAFGKVIVHADKKTITAIFNELIQALNKEDKDVRLFAIKALEKVAAHADKEAIATLLNSLKKALSDKDTNMLLSAAIILKEIATQVNKKTITTFLKLLKKILGHKNWNLCDSAEKTLEKIAAYADKETTPLLLNWLLNTLSDRKLNALVESDCNDELWPSEVERKALDILLSAVRALGQVAAHADKEAFAIILNELKIILSDQDLSRSAAMALEKVATNTNKDNVLILLDWLQMALNENDLFVSRSIAKAIRTVIAYADSQVIPSILDWLQMALSNKNVDVYLSAATVLGEVATHLDQEIIPTFLDWLQIALLEDTDLCVRRSAANTLLEVSAHVHLQTFPTLLNLLQKALIDTNDYVRQSAVKAIGKIADHGNKEIIHTSLDSLEDALIKEWYVRKHVASTLGEIIVYTNKETKPTVFNLLQKALIDTDDYVRQSAVKAIGKVAAYMDKETIPNLLNLIEIALNDKHENVRQSAEKAVGEIVAYMDEETIPALLDRVHMALINEDDWHVRESTANVLRKVVTDRTDEKTILILLKMLQMSLRENNEYVYRAAKASLNHLGTKWLLPTFISQSEDYSFLKSFIFVYFINQSISLYFTEGCFICTSDTSPIPFNENEKDSIVQLCKEQFQNSSIL